MWSIGCIVAEMILGTSLFPGKDQADQLLVILETLGGVSMEEMAHLRRPKVRTLIRNVAY